MFRLAFAVLVLAAALIAGVLETPFVPLAMGDDGRAATTAHAPQSCTDTDGDGEWSPQRDGAASTTESAWRWRSLHAAFAAVRRQAAIVAIRTADPPKPRTPAAPLHLLHAPLLI